jgi:hypothetical protein
MNNHRWRATGLLAAGLVAGGILAANLGATAADKQDVATKADRPHHARVHFGGPGSSDLAKELGVSEEKLRAAFEAIHDDVRPAERPSGPPNKDVMRAMQSKMSAALAEELGISQEKVEAAFAKQHEEFQARHRAELSKRLDTAVGDGKLTADDKKSVLKAFDAGVLDGPHRMVIAHR